MYKVVLILALGLFSYDNPTSTDIQPETQELCNWVYWDAFSHTFNKTANYWKAESAALEAEKLADSRTGTEEFLKAIDLKKRTE